MIQVTPASLKERLAAVGYGKDGGVTHDFRSHFLFEGDCAHLLTPIQQSRLDDEINQLFAQQMNWRKIQAYSYLRRRLKEGKPFRHNNVLMGTQADIDRYFERYVRLTESIDRHGYKTREELKRVSKTSMKRRWWMEAGEQEVGVAIGPAGEVWRFGGGYHRTAIARNLGLKSMPVRVRLVHGDAVNHCGNGRSSWHDLLFNSC